MSRLKPFFIMEEIWKNIPNYENIYQVSNLGRVKSLDKYVNYSDGRIRFYKSKILKQSIGNGGYLFVGFDGKSFKISQLVAMAFLSHKPYGMKKVVHHIDNDKTNNKVCNLEIVSQRKNSYTHHIGTSKYTGVSWDSARNKWKSNIRINNKSKFLGRFNTEIEASMAYQNAINNLI